MQRAWVQSLVRELDPECHHWDPAWKWKWSHSVVSDTFQPHVLWPTRLLHPWDFPGKNTGVACHFLLQEIFLTQRLNLGLPHCRQTLYCLSHQEGPRPSIAKYINVESRKVGGTYAEDSQYIRCHDSPTQNHSLMLWSSRKEGLRHGAEPRGGGWTRWSLKDPHWKHHQPLCHIKGRKDGGTEKSPAPPPGGQPPLSPSLSTVSALPSENMPYFISWKQHPRQSVSV